jgi:membrane-bound lytic murein transglycosylase MltF
MQRVWAVALVLWGGGRASLAQDLAELKARGVLRVVVDTSNQKERFNLGTGEPGIEREILQNFASLNGMKLGIVSVGPPSSVAFAVRKDCPQLRAALDDYVANLRKTPTWSRLVVKHFGESALEILKKSRIET